MAVLGIMWMFDWLRISGRGDARLCRNADMTNIMEVLSPAEREAKARFISGL
jgi:hypothetical protein